MQGRSADHLEQRFDRWVNRGRDLIDGVAGARPGNRASAGVGPTEPEGERRGRWRHELDGLGRWVGTRLDTLLDDDSDWREPWQEDRRPVARGNPAQGALQPTPALGMPSSARPASGRRALDAISRRGPGPNNDGPPMARSSRPDLQQQPALAQRPGVVAPASEEPELEAWPDDGLFSVPRWSRPIPSGHGALPTTTDPAPGRPGRDRQPTTDREAPPRPLPRSSRRRTP